MSDENQPTKTRVSEFLTYSIDNLGRRKLLVAGAVLLFCAVLFLAGAWFGKGRGAGTAGPGARKILYYVDPMNPAHTSPEPGLAPCGMKLEPVYADGDGKGRDPSLPPGAVKLTSQRQQLLGVRVATVEQAPFTYNLRALGKVAVDERLIYRLNAAVEGWIREAGDNSTGSVVKKDETLAIIYSPEFLAPVQAYLYMLSSLDRFQASGKETPAQIEITRLNVQQYIESLRNLGMSDLQIRETRAGPPVHGKYPGHRAGHQLHPGPEHLHGPAVRAGFGTVPVGGPEAGLGHGGPVRERGSAYPAGGKGEGHLPLSEKNLTGHGEPGLAHF